jgi:hypothetical protein
MKRRSQSAVALVTTLIMLSLITFTAVVFLAITMREKDSVSVSGDMMDAKNLAEIASMDAQAHVISHIVATTNPYIYGLMVSETAVPYRLTVDNPLPENDVTNFISQLIYDARPPVYVQTNSNPSNHWEHRFWLDVNRNNRFEPTGTLPERDALGAFTLRTNYYVGDPQWKGVLNNSFPTNYGGEWPVHSRTNRFGGRYAWMVVPYGKTLSVNHIDNYAKKLSVNMDRFTINASIEGSGFRRNMGFGSHELNLAAYLAQLNPTVWTNGSTIPYFYDTNLLSANLGYAFDDALALLSHRYSAYTDLPAIGDLNYYGAVGGTAIGSDGIDSYLYGPLMTGLSLPTNDYDTMLVNSPYPGAISTNYNQNPMFDIMELWASGREYSVNGTFGASVFGGNNSFQGRLMFVGTNDLSTENRYTFSRLLATLGTDTALPGGERIHINYDNRVPNSPTNFIGWTASNFFHEAAERLLRTNYDVSLTDLTYTNRIQIYPTNNYSAGIHRILQVTANIYDATTNQNATYPYFPTVFRPIFTNSGGIVTIAKYEEVTTTNPVYYGYITRQEAGTNASYVNTLITNNIWGVPWVIGAKKGHPGFNEFALRTAVQLTRRLEVLKANTNTPVTLRQTNQLFVLGISNLLGAEMWNPYTNSYPRDLDIVARLDTFAHLTNQLGAIRSRYLPMSTNAFFPANTWSSNGFFLPFNTNYVFLPDSVFFNSLAQFIPVTNIVGTNVVYERGQQFYTPRWGLSTSNRMFAAIMDRNSNRVIDFVNFDSFTFGVEDLTTGFVNAQAFPGASAGINTALLQELFDTNRIGGNTVNHVTRGLLNQIFVSLGRNSLQGRAVSQQDWNNYGLQSQSVQDKTLAIATFQRFMGQPLTGVAPYHANPNGNSQYYVKMPPSTNMQAPFTVVAKIVYTNYWQANDPLVHYTLDDLGDAGMVNLPPFIVRPSSVPLITNNLGFINGNYAPWGVRRSGAGGGGLIRAYDEPTPVDYTFEYRVKDPQIRKPDDWDFPGQKFGNVGWLGRVHRGTPWQTIYLKAGRMPDEAPTYDWRRWAYSAFTHPTNDWAMMDMFTVATDVPSVSGLLSVNQTNYAAWAAVLGDVMVLSNTINFNDAVLTSNYVGTVPTFTNVLMSGTNTTQLRTIVDGINAVRQTRLASLGGGLFTTNAFTRMGQILSVPQLSVGDVSTDSSPYLSLFDSNMLYGINDVALERIPQQILSLLKVDDVPRVVVYAWGQSLKPAANSVVLGGQYKGVVTNYNVVSEYMTRTVLRIEGGPRNPRVVVENYTVMPTEQ